MPRVHFSKLWLLVGSLTITPTIQANTPEGASSEPFQNSSHSIKCGNTIPKSLTPGFSDECILSGGLKRNFRVYRPKNADTTGKYRALVIVLHGGGGSGTLASNLDLHPLAVFQDLADKDNFLALYPHGTADNKEKKGWNDCRSDDTSKSGADDVGFIADLITQAKIQFNFKSSEIFIAGTSNGAMMAYRFGMEKTELIGGIAGASGNIAQNPVSGRCQNGPDRPLPVLMTHGTEDNIVPADGGCVAKMMRLKCRRGKVLSAQDTVQFWLKANGLSQTQPKSKEVNLIKGDGGAAVETTYSNGKVTVVSWSLNGAGHATPSKRVIKGTKIGGKQNQDIEFAEVAWNFFKSQLNH